MLSPTKGKFLVFEGADDLGKSTQIELVYQYLLEKGYKVIKTREPGGTPVGSQLRQILLETDVKLPKEVEALLFMADRGIHVNQVIKPHLKDGYIILCDRYHLSSLVYQHNLKGNLYAFINGLHIDITGNLWPDKTFVFHGTRLTDNVKDVYEKNLGNNTHQKLNNYYYDYGKKFPNHILINANRQQDIIFREILSHIEE